MGLFSDNKSSITFYIDNLSNYPEVEWYQFQQLTDTIVLVPNGPKEAIEAIRKKLKHGGVQQQLRVLDILKLLSENSNQRFHRDLILNEKMKERFEFILDSPSEDMQVKKMVMSLLQNLILRFRNERGIQSIEQLYEKGKLLLYSYPSKKKVNISSSNRKLSIVQDEIDLAHSLANELLNEIHKIDTRRAEWQYELRYNDKIRRKYLNCLEESKKILQYISQVSFQQRRKEEFYWTNKLIASNEELLKVISLYELMVIGKTPFNDEKTRCIPYSNKKEEVLEDPFADPF